MSKRTSYTQARANLASLCDEVAESREPYVIERRNGENVALIAEEELNSIVETAHLMRSHRNVTRLLAAIERARKFELSPSSIQDLRSQFDLEE